MTPLYDAISNYVNTNPLRFHMPGHKGKQIIKQIDFMACDVTELPPTGNLYEAGEPFEQAQQQWATQFQMETCQFLTGGSTQGIYTAFALCTKPGDTVLIDRGCHKAVYHALALLGLEPVYLTRPWNQQWGVVDAIYPEDVERQMQSHPEIKTVCITSPTYSGILSNITEISHVVHRYGGRLIVDGAHGAHLPFLGLQVFEGADCLICSAHKTLPALGQAALLFCNGIDAETVRQTAALFGTSSPSYPILISLDLAREWMEHEGQEHYQHAKELVGKIRKKIPSIPDGDWVDPTRLTVLTRDGRALAKTLQKDNIWPEMEDCSHVIFIVTGADTEQDLCQLEKALLKHENLFGIGTSMQPPPMPEQVMSIRDAIFASKIELPLEQCQGKIAAGQLAPYPPGVPVVAPGERITEKELVYFHQIGYNNARVPVVKETSKQKMEVICNSQR